MEGYTELVSSEDESKIVTAATVIILLDFLNKKITLSAFSQQYNDLFITIELECQVLYS